MRVISTEFGMTLLFTSRKDLQGVVNQLEGFLEHIRTENLQPPYLYTTYCSNVPQKEVTGFLNALKAHWPASEEDHEGR